MSGEAGLVSDYRYRGVSLSHGHPALQAELTLKRAKELDPSNAQSRCVHTPVAAATGGWFGGALLTTTLTLAVPDLPFPSIARTLIVCGPFGSDVVSTLVDHAAVPIAGCG